MTHVEDVLTKAIEKYGEEVQTLKAIEELAELARALSRHLASGRRTGIDAVREEMADVAIMLTQLKMIYGPYSGYATQKLARLEYRMTAKKRKRRAGEDADEQEPTDDDLKDVQGGEYD